MPLPSDLGASASAPLTQLLDAAARGDRAAFDRAFAFLYDELRALAHAQRRRWQGNETLDTRVLVHEAYLKLVRPAEGASPDAEENVLPPAVEPSAEKTYRWHGRKHFFALAAQVMRHVLVNYAEQQRAAKRGGDADRVGLEALDVAPAAARGDATVAFPSPSIDEGAEVLAMHEALDRLEARDPRQARIIECRFFAGLSIPETAEALDISPATVKREWQAARTWLYTELAEKREGGSGL